MKIFLLISLLTAFSANAQSVPNNSPGKMTIADQNNALNAAVNTVSAVFSAYNKDKNAHDTITGSCSYKDGTCNGAQIILTRNNQKIFATTLTSMGTFIIPNLKPKETYNLELIWAKKNLTKSMPVVVGEYVEIKLMDTK